MNDFERLAQAEIDRLKGPGFATSRRARQMRGATIRALAEATVANRPWTGPEGVLGPTRPATIVSENNFYDGAQWYQHPLVREVIERVTELYAQRAVEEKEEARQRNRIWVEQMELQAAAAQFDMAGKLLSLSHVTRKTARKGTAGEETVIINPANAPVFSAAAKLNDGASILARRAVGLPVEVRRSELTGAAGGPIETRRDGLDEVSDDELQRRLGTLARGALAILGGGPVADDATGAAADDSESQE
jgi:hypothetical protein